MFISIKNKETKKAEYVKQRYGDRLSMDGTIGTQTVFPIGKPEDVRNE